MPTFRYQSLHSGTRALSNTRAPSGGELQLDAAGHEEGAGGVATIDAADRASALRALRQRGITPTSLEEVGSKASRSRFGAQGGATGSGTDAQSTGRDQRGATAPEARTSLSQRGTGDGTGLSRGLSTNGGMTKVEMASFIRELATATQAGLPLVPALKTILRQYKKPRSRRVLESVIDSVEHGKSLADAAQKIGKPFNELTVSLIRAGEVSGRQGEVLEQSANLLDRELKMRRTLIAGLIYPMILFVLIAGAIVVISTFIVPRILSTFSRASVSSLPIPTRMVMWSTSFVSSYWWAILLVIGGCLLSASWAYRTPGPRLAIDRFLLRVPMLGKVLRDVAVARFTRTLGTLVSAGLPALTALRITRATLGNKALERVIDEVCEQVSSGKTISEPLERSGYFPPLLTQIVGLGEKSGRLAPMLNQAAGVFEDRTETSIKVFTTAFPPLMVVVASCFVGFVIAAVLLPLIQMQELIG